MSEILVDNLTGKTSAGDITVTSEGGAATFQMQQAMIKHWSNYDQSTTPSANQDSFNSSSVTDSATGQYYQNYTNNMSNTNYAASALSQQVVTDLVGSTPLATSSIYINIRNISFADTDANDNLVMVAGDLA